MGKLSLELRRIFEKAKNEKVVNLNDFSMASQKAKENIKSIPSVQSLVLEGRDPHQALYLNTLNLMSVFSEEVNVLTPFRKIYDFISEWHDTYGPSFPPISPITNSFFTCWSILDISFDNDRDTIGTCFVNVADLLEIDELQVEAAKKLCQSRMGIYEVLEQKGEYCLLQELVTHKEIKALIGSGYIGEKGDLLLTRLVAPLTDEFDTYFSLITPHKLMYCSKDEWLKYFKRHDIYSGSKDLETKLINHMKFVKYKVYWSEYIFYGFFNFRPEVIFLMGFPDQLHTQPCHEKYKGPSSMFMDL